MAGNNYLRGAGGKFAGSKGGLSGAHAGGGKTLGGARGIVARSRLRQAQRRLAEIKSEAKSAKSRRVIGKLKKRLARAGRSVAAHQREVRRIEKRGLLGVKSSVVRATLRDRHAKFSPREIVPGVAVRARVERARGALKATIGQRIERIRERYYRQQISTNRLAASGLNRAASRSGARERKLEGMLARLRSRQK